MPAPGVRNSRLGPQPYAPKSSETVLSRDEQLYARELDELMEIFRAIQKVLEELGFQQVNEDFSEHWETLPFKTGIEAWKWKDPYTAMMADFKLRVKEPRSDRKTDDDVYKVKITLKSKLIRTRYPNWQWFENSSILKRSGLYRFIYKLTNNFLYAKEQQKYREEAEETGLELISRLREIEGTLPAIGRSTREYYNPHNQR